MVSPIIKSGLKKAVEQLPDTVKAESLPNLLKKQGAKAEELEFSGVGEALPKTGRVTKEQVQQIEAGRADEFGVVEARGQYQDYSLEPGKLNPTYRENVYTFRADPTKGMTVEQRVDLEMERLAQGIAHDPLVPKSRYTSSHFDVPNYLMHTRTYEDSINGKATHVIQEIQSDLHQAGRQTGYAGADEVNKEQVNAALKQFEDANNFWYPDEGVSLAKTEEDAGRLQDEAVATIKKFFPSLPDDQDLIGLTADNLVKMYPPTPKSPYEKSWLAKGMEREMAAAFEAGKDQVAIPISGDVASLKRGEGVQRWYETRVLSTAKKLAKSHNMDFEIVTHGAKKNLDLTDRNIEELQDFADQADVRGLLEYASNADARLVPILEAQMEDIANGKLIKEVVTGSDTVSYAVIKRKPGQMPSFSLYSSPAAAATAAYVAFQQGYSEDEVRAKLDEQGYDKAEADAVFEESKKIAVAVQQGYTLEEIKGHLDGKEPQVDTVDSVPTSPIEEPPGDKAFGQAYRELTGNEELSAKELLAKIEVVAPNTSMMTTNIAGFFGNEEARRTSEAAALASQNRIIELAKAKGLDLVVQEGNFFAQTEQGLVPVTPEWWRSFWEAKGEVAGAVGGAIAGYKAGAAMTPPVLPFVGPAAKPIGGVLGSIVGAAVGSVVGTETDYIHNAIVLQEDMNAEIMARKALTAAEASVLLDTAFLGAGKLVGKSWKGIVKAKDYVKQGMFDRARTALKEQLFLTDDEAAELVVKLQRVADVPGKNQAEQEIAASMLTQPGSEGIVKASTLIDPKASAAVAKSIDTRAQDLLATTKDLSDENVGRILQNELTAYSSAVKENFGRVKAVPAQSPKANQFKFNYDKIAIDPALERLSKNIDNPDVAYKFAKHAQKIRDMSSTRSLSDLVELRKLVNDFKYNKRISRSADFKMLNDVLGRIDHAIEQGAYHTLDNPKGWLGEFKQANLDYAKMKGVEKNVLTKVINRPGVSEKVIGQALAKYAYAIDDTFVELMAQMPKQTKRKVEGAVLDSLANKYTAGIEGGQRAVNFPMLAKDLQGITFGSPEARSTKRAIMELAEVFKNDIPLAQASGNIQIPKFQSFLTADPVVRAKFEFASGLFNYIKQLAPGSKARNIQLVQKTAKVLEQPLNAKSINELTKELSDAPELQQQLTSILEEAAKRQASTGSTGMPRVKLYGDGKVLTAKGKGKQQSIPMHRIASTDQARQTAEAKGINMADTKALYDALRDQGYMAIQLGADSVKRID